MSVLMCHLAVVLFGIVDCLRGVDRNDNFEAQFRICRVDESGSGAVDGFLNRSSSSDWFVLDLVFSASRLEVKFLSSRRKQYNISSRYYRTGSFHPHVGMRPQNPNPTVQ